MAGNVPEEQKVAYDKDIYLCIYREIVQRIGSISAATITRMAEEDYGLYEPKEAVDRLLVPMAGLFGPRMTKSIIVTSLSGSYGAEEAEKLADEMLK